MARLYKRPNSSYWSADYLLSDGSRRRISTKKKDRASAKLILESLIASESAANRSRLTKRAPPRSATAPRKIHPHPDAGSGAGTNPPVNLRQLARIAGVSAATASLALRNDRGVRQSTRERIQKLAVDLGYRPNPLVSVLMASRVRLRQPSEHQVIAYLTAFANKDVWKKYQSFMNYFQGAQDRAAQAGYKLEEFYLRDSQMNSMRMSSLLYHRGIHGLLIAPLPDHVRHLSLKWDHFSAATIGYSLTRPFVHRATHDTLQAMRTSLRQLRKLGYRRIALVVQRSQDRRSNSGWFAGFSEFMQLQRERDRVRPYLYSAALTEDPKFHLWLRRERPEAIISGTDLVLKWMSAAGLSAPEDFGFAQLDRASAIKGYSGIDQNSRAVGAAAIDLIIGQISRNERGLPELPKTTIVPVVWVEGDTARKVR